MTDLYTSSSTVSPIIAILWCFYPIAILIIVELILGGGFDDDNNDDQDGGMLIPAYSRSNIWLDSKFTNCTSIKISLMVNNINTTLISLITLTILITTSLSWLILRTIKEGRLALKELNKDLI